MYRLKQAARLAYDLLKKRLLPFGYYPDKICPNIWKHTTNSTTFILCVDDFGVKYFTRQEADHLIMALKSNYDITIDWTGENYCGLNIKWNYLLNYVDVSMPNYVIKFLAKQGHKNHPNNKMLHTNGQYQFMGGKPNMHVWPIRHQS